jgi:hypothetical protein
MSDGVINDPGAGTPPPWSGFIATLPDTLDNVVSIRDSGAYGDGRVMRGPVVQHETVTIRIRGLDYVQCYQKGIEIQNALEGINNVVVATELGDVKIRVFKRTTPLSYIGTEEKKNWQNFVIVGNVTLEEV